MREREKKERKKKRKEGKNGGTEGRRKNKYMFFLSYLTVLDYSIGIKLYVYIDKINNLRTDNP